MNHIRKYLRAAIYSLLILFTGLAIIITLVARTATGSRILISQILPLLNINIQIENLSGNLMTGLTLEKLRYEDPFTMIESPKLQWRWTPLTAFWGTLRIDDLNSAAISITVIPQGDQPTTPVKWTALKLPINISVNNLKINQLQIITATASSEFNNIELSASASSTQLNLQHFSIAYANWAANFRGRFQTTPPYQFTASSEWSVTPPIINIIKGQAILEGDIDTIHLQHILEAPYSVQSKGLFQTGLRTNIKPTISISNQWVNAALPWAELTSRDGRLDIEGWLDQYNFNGELQVQGHQIPDSIAVISGTGDIKHLQFDKLTVQGLDGYINGDGKLHWLPQFSWDANLIATELNPTFYQQELRGKLNFSLNSKGDYKNDIFTGDVKLEKLQGILRDHALSGQGQLQFTGTRLSSNNLELIIANNRASLKGTLHDQRADLHWQIDANNLSTVWPDLAGQVSGAGQFIGKLNAPILTGKLQASNLQYKEYAIEKFETDITQTETPQTSILKYVAELKAEGIKLNTQLINHILIRGTGNLDEHQLTLTINSPQIKLASAIEGKFISEPIASWKARLLHADIQPQDMETWSLQQVTETIINKDQYTIKPACWIQETATACVDFHYSSDKGYLVSAKLSDVPTSPINLWLPSNIRVQGLLNSTLSLRGQEQQLALELKINPQAGELILQHGTDDTEHFPWQNTFLNLELKKQQWTLNSEIEFTHQGRGKASLSWHEQTEALSGNINIDFENISLIESFAPLLRKPQGQLSSVIKLGGTRSNPLIEGRTELQNASVSIPELGITLHECGFTAINSGRDRITVNGQLQSNSGKVEFKGAWSGLGKPDWKLEINAQGNNFKILNLNNIKAQINPDINIISTAKAITVEGKVLIPSADIKLKTIPEFAVLPSNDTIIIDQEKEELEITDEKFNIFSKIQVTLGEHVRFEGIGFETKLSGSLLIDEKPGRPTLANGELLIDEGSYKAYGQNLNIERGQLLFQGPYDNPGLDVRAVRKIPDITVGVDIGGTLKNMQSKIFSIPAMAESEAVAILFTGKPLSDSSDSDTNALINAIATLGIEKGTGLTNQIASSFGLDEVAIDTESDLASSSLLIGKYLTPRLYIRYAVGLFDQSSNLALNYQLSKRLELSAITGTKQSMDLTYRIER